MSLTLSANPESQLQFKVAKEEEYGVGVVCVGILSTSTTSFKFRNDFYLIDDTKNNLQALNAIKNGIDSQLVNIEGEDSGITIMIKDGNFIIDEWVLGGTICTNLTVSYVLNLNVINNFIDFLISYHYSNKTTEKTSNNIPSSRRVRRHVWVRRIPKKNFR